MIMWEVCQYHQGGIAIVATGAAVIALGATSAINTLGSGHEKAIWISAWVVVGIGTALLLSYFINLVIAQLAGVGG